MFSKRAWSALAVALLGVSGALAGACVPTPKSGFDERGFLQGEYKYRINGDGEQILGDSWLLDNFHKGMSGKTVPKDGNEYMTIFDFDVDGDGDAEAREEGLLYDLRLKHRKRDAVIWARTFPISKDLADKDLRVLMQSYIDEVAGAGYESVQIHPTRRIVQETRYAAATVERGPARVAGYDAYSATIDVANIDQIKLTPGKYERRVKLVLVKPPFQYRFHGVTQTKSQKKFPARMLVGYANLPEDFEKDLPDFTKFLERIEIKGKRGFSAQVEETSAKPAPHAPSATTDGGAPAAPSAAADASIAPSGDAEATTPATVPAPTH
jgi:hypothetical protein